jgi:hypothetical protein
MFAKVNYLGYYPISGDLELDGIKIMQFDWNLLRRPIIFPFGKSAEGVSPAFSNAFVVEENEKAVFFLAKESGIGKYHIWSFSDKTAKKIARLYLRKNIQGIHKRRAYRAF